MGWLKGMGDELGTEEGNVVKYGKDFDFCVEMVKGTYLHTAGGYADGGVLDPLGLFKGGGGGIGEPDGGGVGEEGGDERFVNGENGLFAPSPGGTSKGPQEGAGDKGRYVGGRG